MLPQMLSETSFQSNPETETSIVFLWYKYNCFSHPTKYYNRFSGFLIVCQKAERERNLLDYLSDD